MIAAPGQYDVATQTFGGEAGKLGGGCDVLRIRNGTLIDHRATLGGTIVNCAGGVTPWRTWITSEETIFDGTSLGGKKHGYNFECSIDPAETIGQPLVAMGRFAHEAIAVDPVTGCVYQTEDNRNLSALYRFKPTSTERRYGALAQGAKLQAARIFGIPRARLLAPGGVNAVSAVGQTLEFEWGDLDSYDPLSKATCGFWFCEPNRRKGVTQGGDFDIRNRSVAECRKSIGFECRQPLRLVLTVPPALLMLLVNLLGGLLECRNAIPLSALQHRIDACFDLGPDERGPLSRELQWNFARASQADIPATPAFLHTDNPAFSARLADNEEQALAIAIAAGLFGGLHR